jgi:hypothetical protein
MFLDGPGRIRTCGLGIKSPDGTAAKDDFEPKPAASSLTLEGLVGVRFMVASGSCCADDRRA